MLIACAAIIVILGGIKLASRIVCAISIIGVIAIICSPVVNYMTKRKVPRQRDYFFVFRCLFFLASLINTVQEVYSIYSSIQGTVVTTFK